jgi:hypothetical protein
MSEPTIDEMLAWFDSDAEAETPMHNAIRAILEQHREWNDVHAIAGHTMIDPKKALASIRIDAIRAFVERVEKRSIKLLVETDGNKAQHIKLTSRHWVAIQDELAAMEADNDRTND